ncbi:unnamed protein product [Phaedon cochleariae]|uniref:Uncharacterized protein n=1 Tax=Phaedon cochleariae TaxID=80249 RepID=A0A9N9SFF1_PHACE|nr:unnamed protein product [Phaedon cochleariae]
MAFAIVTSENGMQAVISRKAIITRDHNRAECIIFGIPHRVTINGYNDDYDSLYEFVTSNNTRRLTVVLESTLNVVSSGTTERSIVSLRSRSLRDASSTKTHEINFTKILKNIENGIPYVEGISPIIHHQMDSTSRGQAFTNSSSSAVVNSVPFKSSSTSSTSTSQSSTATSQSSTSNGPLGTIIIGDAIIEGDSIIKYVTNVEDPQFSTSHSHLETIIEVYEIIGEESISKDPQFSTYGHLGTIIGGDETIGEDSISKEVTNVECPINGKDTIIVVGTVMEDGTIMEEDTVAVLGEIANREEYTITEEKTVVGEDTVVTKTAYKRRICNKPNICKFCMQSQTNIKRHIISKHRDQAEVREFIMLTDNNPIKKKERRDGNFNSYKESEKIVPARISKFIPPVKSAYSSCPYCQIILKKQSLIRHVLQSCTKKDSKHSRGVLKMSKAISESIHDRANDVVRKLLFPALRDGPVKEAIRFDSLLILYGNEMACKYRSQHHYPMIRNRLIRMAKVLLRMKEISASVNNFGDMLRPQMFDNLIEIINSMREYDTHTGNYRKPTLPTEIGKLARGVPVLLHNSMHECIKLLIKFRNEAGVENNPYLFGLPQCRNDKNVIYRHLIATSLIRKYSDACGATNPKSLRATTLRKHVATTSMSLNLNNEEIQLLQGYLGHAEKIHRDYYRQPIIERDILNVSKVLLAAQSTSPVHSFTGLGGNQPELSTPVPSCSVKAYTTTTTTANSPTISPSNSSTAGPSGISNIAHGSTESGSEYIASSDGNSSKLEKDLQTTPKRKRQRLIGKLARGVPVLLHNSMHECIKLLIKFRNEAGVENNPYLFGLPQFRNDKNVIYRHLIATSLIRKYSDACGATNPKSLRATTLRKHVATTSMSLNLNNEEIQLLQGYLGHAEKIHRDYYRQPIIERGNQPELSTPVPSCSVKAYTTTTTTANSPTISPSNSSTAGPSGISNIAHGSTESGSEYIASSDGNSSKLEKDLQTTPKRKRQRLIGGNQPELSTPVPSCSVKAYTTTTTTANSPTISPSNSSTAGPSGISNIAHGSTESGSEYIASSDGNSSESEKDLQTTPKRKRQRLIANKIWNTPRKHAVRRVFKKFIGGERAFYPPKHLVEQMIIEHEEFGQLTPRRIRSQIQQQKKKYHVSKFSI